MSKAQDEPTIESLPAFKGRLISVRVDTVRLPDGETSTREIVEHSACVCAVPLEDKDNVVLVRQYRKPAEALLLEVPAGGIEPGESPEQAMLRELQEETGYTARSVKHLCSFWMSPGYCTEEMHAYLATDLEPSALRPDRDENIEVVKVPIAEVPHMIRKGQIRDAKSIASLLLAMRALEEMNEGSG